MTRNIKLTIEYDGSNFQGWQIQATGFRTVQNEITQVLRKIFKENIHVLGSGRTDSGVHALGQVAHFRTKSVMPVAIIKRALKPIDDEKEKEAQERAAERERVRKERAKSRGKSRGPSLDL